MAHNWLTRGSPNTAPRQIRKHLLLHRRQSVVITTLGSMHRFRGVLSGFVGPCCSLVRVHVTVECVSVPPNLLALCPNCCGAHLDLVDDKLGDVRERISPCWSEFLMTALAAERL